MSWTPDPEGLQQILQTLHESNDTQNREAQRNVTLKLNSFTRVPDYPAYLAHILSQIPSLEDRMRTIAGYLLKNNARLVLKLTPQTLEFVQSCILRAFSEGGAMVRNAAGQDIVAVLATLSPRNWPQALTALVTMLDSDTIDQQEAAFYVLEKCCEDFPRALDEDFGGQRPMDYLIPKFLTLSEHPVSKMRAHAIACLSHFVPIQSPSLFNNIDAFLASLFKRASDEDSEVRKHVCHGLVLLLATTPDRLMPEINNVAEYMLFSTQDKHETVALESCEFWLTFAEDPDLANQLLPLLPRVAPVLLSCMVYGEDDLLWLDGDEDDAAVPDKETDIKPKFYGGKSHGMEHQDENAGGETPKPRGIYSSNDPNASAEEEEGDADSFDSSSDFDDDLSTEWNLRKCSAAALDVLAVRFGADLMNVLLPHLKEKLWSTDWLQRECGILALGAMAEGCIEAIEPHLPTLIPYLHSMLNDPKPLVRSITCWTLGRYANWCTSADTEEHRHNYFIPAMEGLLRMVLDNNKRVQEAGCSAFATLEEEAGTSLIPYLDPILRNLVYAFDKYQHKNMLILYDAVGTLADSVGSALQSRVYVEILMPPLLRRWEKCAGSDEDLVPLLECLASVAIAMGPAFLPYAGPVYNRCVEIVRNSLIAFQTWQQNPDLDEPERSFLVVALDMLSGLVQGLGMALEPYVRTQPNLLELLVWCLKHPQAPVRQSGYALVGDMAVSCFPLIRPYMSHVMSELVLQLDPEPRLEYVSACNNAAWSVGEVALKYGRDDPEFAQWVPTLVQRLIPILLHPKAPRSLHENAAVSLGRIGLEHPTLVAPHLEIFAQAWCQALFEIKDNEEKDSAFRGFCTLVQTNPGGIGKSFLWFCNSIVRWATPSSELREMFHKILNGFKEMNPPAWEAQLRQMPVQIQERLRELYHV